MTDNQDGGFLDYAAGATTPDGKTIKFIYGQSEEVVVFEDEGGRVQWETADVAPHHTEVHHRFDRLHARLYSAIGKHKQSSMLHELAQALYRALSESDRLQA